MARLIDADELKKNFQDDLCKGIACAECSMQAEGFCRVERWIDIAPTIDAEPIMYDTGSWQTTVTDLPPVEYAPVKHGRWIDSWGGKWHSCSVCGGVPPFNFKGEDLLTDYCPHCGARMDESTMGQLNPDEPINYHIENDGTYRGGE